MNTYVPGMQRTLTSIQNKINNVRKAEPGSKKYLNLSAHGAQRAAEAKNAREKKASVSAAQIKK